MCVALLLLLLIVAEFTSGSIFVFSTLSVSRSLLHQRVIPTLLYSALHSPIPLCFHFLHSLYMFHWSYWHITWMNQRLDSGVLCTFAICQFVHLCCLPMLCPSLVLTSLLLYAPFVCTQLLATNPMNLLCAFAVALTLILSSIPLLLGL